MKHVFALFSDAAAAEKAVEKLSEGGLDTSKARIHSKQTIEQSTGIRAMPTTNAASPMGGGAAGSAGGSAAGGTVSGGPGAVMTDDTIEGYLSNIGVDGDEYAFYVRGIKDGGHIVGIDVANDEEEKATAALVDTGGKVPHAE